MAAVIDLDTVINNPARVDELLPPYQLTAHHEPAPPLEPAIPRVRYPISVSPAAPRPATSPDVLRVAQAPHATADNATAARQAVSPHAALPDASQLATGKAAGKTDDWLIDPKEWYTSGEGKKAEPQPPATETAKPVTPPEPSAPTVTSPTPTEPAAASTEPAKSEPSEPAATSVPTLPAEPVVPRVEPAPSLPAPVPPKEPAPTPSPLSLPSEPATAKTPAERPVVEPAAVEPTKPIFTGPPPVGDLPAQQPASPHAASPHAPHGPASSKPASKPGVDPHLELFAKNNFPSARDCAQCHEEIYKDWAISAHAYAAVSPMFQGFEQKLNDLSQGTVGYFCIRCHAPIATAMCASRAEPLWNLPEVAREGITCIACHRVQYAYGKSNGERRVETGDIFAPVLGGIGGDGVAEAIERKDEFKVKTSPEEKGPGQNIHATGIYFQTLTRSEFCTPCHQVAVHPGIKLEVVWEQYRASPACKKGIQCQDCHMGKVPGLPLGYDCGPIAKIGDKTVNNNRKKSNHVFYGPNYPIAHPGIFPFNLKANRWTMEQWLTFDWRGGWGTKEFEKAVDEGQIQVIFPPVWAEVDDRFDAREIIDQNIKQMERKRDIRVQVMENGSHVDGPFFDSQLGRGHDLKFHYDVTNTNDGHNLLTASLGAQPQLWANVVLIGPDGRRIWETGYVDSDNDVANIHSVDVRNHRLPYDKQLFNLQTMFLVQGATGTDREFYVPVNFDFDQLPFIRPGVQPITTINHPPGIRMESRSLAPLGSRKAHYHVPGHLIQQPGRYRLSFRLRSRSEPIYFMRFCEATPEMVRMENEWMIDVHPMTVEFEVR